jgi:hypothetical protein
MHAVGGVTAHGSSKAAVGRPAVAGLVGPAPEQRLDPQTFNWLMRLAPTRPQLRWQPGADIAGARNCHRTNTGQELLAGLTGNFNWFEGDVRIERGTVIMAHDKGQSNGMSLAEWLTIGGRSGRGLKLDIKETAAILPAVQMAKAAGVPDGRLIVNVTVGGGREVDVTSQQLAAIRAMYPGAIVNLSPGASSYSPGLMRTLGRVAQQVGGPVMFPLRWDLVGPNVIAALKPFGKIAIWNSPANAPRDIPREIARLRAMGVDGMIDLRRA